DSSSTASNCVPAGASMPVRYLLVGASTRSSSGSVGPRSSRLIDSTTLARSFMSGARTGLRGPARREHAVNVCPLHRLGRSLGALLRGHDRRLAVLGPP